MVNFLTSESGAPPQSSFNIYPCEYGFHYLVASSAVWICFLPFWISALFGNCWRQCCCCCCDPIVLCGTIIDFVKVVIFCICYVFQHFHAEVLL
jgi:hypothetical protein